MINRARQFLKEYYGYDYIFDSYFYYKSYDYYFFYYDVKEASPTRFKKKLYR